MAIKTATELVSKCKEVVQNYKTLYVLGCFGAPMNAKNKSRYCKNKSYNQQAGRANKIQAASSDTFGFDCVCLIKGLLWGWDGDTSKTYGGASYNSNNVTDISADQMIKKCKEVSTDFTNIVPGEAVWIEGHIGVYIGDGLAIECTPKWKDGVQITAVHNIGKKSGYNGRKWTKHGKLPYVTYETPVAPKEPAKAESTPSSTNTSTTSKKATDSAKSFLKSLAGTYKVTASSLNVRNGAGVTKKKMVSIPKGTAVKCFGYYTSVLGTKWLYIQFTYNNVQYTGFASSNYLKK